jgi:predicted flap endonuclease-1-like 5' DNA nuclease
MADSVRELRNITSEQTEKLAAQKIVNTDDLLERAGSAANRKTLAGATGISEKDLLELANRADLARISGVGRQYANLLEDAGVDSIPELAQRNPANLLAALEKSAEASGITRKPRLGEVEEWISQAKSLPRAVSH